MKPSVPTSASVKASTFVPDTPPTDELLSSIAVVFSIVSVKQRDCSFTRVGRQFQPKTVSRILCCIVRHYQMHNLVSNFSLVTLSLCCAVFPVLKKTTIRTWSFLRRVYCDIELFHENEPYDPFYRWSLQIDVRIIWFNASTALVRYKPLMISIAVAASAAWATSAKRCELKPSHAQSQSAR